MLLSDRSIKEAIQRGELSVAPTSDGFLQPASLDVRLGSRFRLLDPTAYTHIDPREKQPRLTIATEPDPGKPWIFPARGFALATTMETVKLGHNIAAQLAGKSSLARSGLQVEAAGWVDPGFEGQLTFELLNLTQSPMLLWPGMEVAQLCFLRTSTPVERLYGSRGLRSRYQGQRGPTPGRPWKKFTTITNTKETE